MVPKSISGPRTFLTNFMNSNSPRINDQPRTFWQRFKLFEWYFWLLDGLRLLLTGEIQVGLPVVHRQSVVSGAQGQRSEDLWMASPSPLNTTYNTINVMCYWPSVDRAPRVLLIKTLVGKIIVLGHDYIWNKKRFTTACESEKQYCFLASCSVDRIGLTHEPLQLGPTWQTLETYRISRSWVKYQGYMVFFVHG